MNLTLVAINFNGAADTLRLLASLEKQTDKVFDLIIVDNDSTQEDRERLGAGVASSAISVDVIYTGRNLGFSGGNNVGIRKALAQGAQWVVLINNDTTVEADFIGQLRSALPAHSAVVGLPLSEGGRTVYAGKIAWNSPTLGHSQDPGVRHDAYAIGAAVAIHCDVFEHIGLLDEKYFLYFEDAEFSVRARRSGIPVEFLDHPVVRHAVSATTRTLGSPLLLRYHFRNMIRFNRQHAPLTARCALPFILMWVCVKQLIKILIGRSRPHSRAILAGITDGILERSGNILRRPVIAVECESLEDVSWGMARQVRGFMDAFTDLPEVQHTYDVVAYFKSRIPDEPWLHRPHVRAVVVRPFAWLPPSFSLYFYVFFPIRLWFDRPVVTYISNYMLPLLFIGKSIVMLTEDIWYEMYGSALPLKYRAAYRIFATWASRRATRIMAISHSSGRNVAELFRIPSERIVINELAVDPVQRVTPREGSYVLYVAQGLPRRHLRETILAFARISSAHPGLKLLAIGPDKYQPPVIGKLVDETNTALGTLAVEWIQRVDDDALASAYAGAQALVYVSDREGFGLPPIEALTYGVPSVLMDAPVHRELLGENAFYAPTGEVAAIAAAMERALTDDAHRSRIRQAAQSVISRYTWNAHALRMLAVIQSIT